MDVVESIILTSCRLLEATEVSLVAETKPVLFFVLDVATPHAEAQHSSVQNILYVCVIFLMYVLQWVQIYSSGVTRVKNDENGTTPPAAQNTRSSSPPCVQSNY